MLEVKCFPFCIKPLHASAQPQRFATAHCSHLVPERGRWAPEGEGTHNLAAVEALTSNPRVCTPSTGR